MSEAELLNLLVGRLLGGDDLPQCDALAELLKDFPAVRRAVRSQLQGRLAAAGVHRVDDDLLGDALGFLVVNLERGHNLAGSIWRAAAWVAEGRRFVTMHDYRDLLGCETVTHATLTDGRYFGVADRTAQMRDDFGALVDDRQLEPWQAVAIAEETERRESREKCGRTGSRVVGEWLADLYLDAFGVSELDVFSEDEMSGDGADDISALLASCDGPADVMALYDALTGA